MRALAARVAAREQLSTYWTYSSLHFFLTDLALEGGQRSIRMNWLLGADAMALIP
jgi:hypothetical protein